MGYTNVGTGFICINVLIFLHVTFAANLGDDAVRESHRSEFQELKEQIHLNKSILGGRRAFSNDQVPDPQSMILESDRDPLDVLLRRTETLLEYLQSTQNLPRYYEVKSRLRELRRRSEFSRSEGLAKTGDSSAQEREKLFMESAALRRELVFMDGRLSAVDTILFIVRGVRGGSKGSPSEYDGEHFCDQYYGHNGRGGGGLYFLINPFTKNPKRVNVVENAKVENGPLQGQSLVKGTFISPELSFDGTTIYFGWSSGGNQKWEEQNRFHIFKIRTDGSGLRQLTFSKNDDFDPCELPNGRIAFISTRRGGYGRCHGRPVPTYTLHSMKNDGSDIITLSYHETNEFHPCVDNNGMIVYTRWDYVDRADCIAHHMWHTTPDGRDPRANHGNYPLPLHTFDAGPWHAGQLDRPHAEHNIRAIPGSTKYMATATPHHGEAFGSLIFIDINIPDDGKMSQVTRITPQVRFPEVEGDRKWTGCCKYGTSWPFDEDLYLVNFERGIHTLDKFGNRELLYQCDFVEYGWEIIRAIDPIPVQPRPKPPVLTTLTHDGESASEKAPNAVISVQSIYESDFEWPANTKIKWLRIIQLFPKSTPNRDNPRAGYADESLARMPLGIVPVESDGSAYFEAPVGKTIYFQALDENHLAVQSMRSATYVHKGEHLSCIGCHENKWKAPPNLNPSAIKRPPSKIVSEIVDGAIPFNWYLLAKPVLGKKCALCHKEKKKGPDMSYSSLRNYVYALPGDISSQTKPIVGGSRSTAGRVGAKASKLLKYLYPSHNNVELTEEERLRITLWLDCNANEFGLDSYKGQEMQRAGKIAWPDFDVDSLNPLGVEKHTSAFPAAPITKQPGINTLFGFHNGKLNFNFTRNQKYEITIYSLKGQVVSRHRVNGSQSISYPVQSASGLHIINVTGENGFLLREKLHIVR